LTKKKFFYHGELEQLHDILHICNVLLRLGWNQWNDLLVLDVGGVRETSAHSLCLGSGVIRINISYVNKVIREMILVRGTCHLFQALEIEVWNKSTGICIIFLQYNVNVIVKRKSKNLLDSSSDFLFSTSKGKIFTCVFD